jgi:signal transduction histidine kinase
MPSQSPSDRPSSTSPLGRPAHAGVLAALSIAVTAVVLIAALQVLPSAAAALATGVVVLATLGSLAVWTLRRDASRVRDLERWHLHMRREMVAQTAFLDGLVAGLGVMASTLDAARVLEEAADQAHRIFAPDATVLMLPAADGLRPAAAHGIAFGPIADLVGQDALAARLRPSASLPITVTAMGELRGVIALLRIGPGPDFEPGEVAQASILGEVAATAVTNAQLFERVESLLAQARMREAERAELSRRVVSAEQDERRKLSLFLHDGPLQSMSGIAMMLDAVHEDTASGELEGALRILDAARDRQRTVIRSIRELSFALEPWVLRDQGFVTAVTAFADEVRRNHRVEIDLDVDAAAAMTPDDQVFLYQIVREAVQNSVKHAGAGTIAVGVTGSPEQGFHVTVRDDGTGFAGPADDDLPHHGMASMRERARILGGRLQVESVPGGGTTIALTVPAGAVDAG